MPAEDRVIRTAVAADQSRVQSIIDAAFSPYTPAIGRPAAPLTRGYADSIREGQVCVIEHAGALSGVAVFHAEGDALHLDVLAVLPEHQGIGLGGMLLEFVEDRAVDQGYRDVHLYTNVVMETSLMFYRARDYVETSRGAFGGYDRIQLQKRFGAAEIAKRGGIS